VVLNTKFNFKENTKRGQILTPDRATNEEWTFFSGELRVFPGVLLPDLKELQNNADALYTYAEKENKLLNWTHDMLGKAGEQMVKVILRKDDDRRYLNPHGWLDSRSRETAKEEYESKVIKTVDMPAAQKLRDFCTELMKLLGLTMTAEQFEATINYARNYPTVPHWDEVFHDGPGLIIWVFCLLGSGILVVEDDNGQIYLQSVCQGDVYTFTGIVRLRWSHGVLVGSGCDRITMTCRLGHLSQEQLRGCLTHFQDRYRADAIHGKMTLQVCTTADETSWSIMVPLRWNCRDCASKNQRNNWPTCTSCKKTEGGVQAEALVRTGKMTVEMRNLIAQLNKSVKRSPIQLIECVGKNSETTTVEYVKANKRTWKSIRNSELGTTKLFQNKPVRLQEPSIPEHLITLAMLHLWPDGDSPFAQFAVVSMRIVTLPKGLTPEHFDMFSTGTIFFVFVLKRNAQRKYVITLGNDGDVVEEVLLGDDNFYTCGEAGTRFPHSVTGPARTLLIIGIIPTAPKWISFSEDQYLTSPHYHYRVKQYDDTEILEWQDPSKSELKSAGTDLARCQR
jgi:hypothetical protein